MIERTASDAAHVGFLCREIGDTQKITLARREADNKLLIELLQHQPCTVAPTAIRCKPEHPEGGVYRVVHGDWAHPLEISPEQRRILLDIARAFNEVPEKTAHEGARTASDGTRPGDHLNETANIDWWQNLLTHHDWRDVSRPGLRAKGIYYFQRPGKIGNGPSATYGRTGQRLYVFSSNAQPFDPGIDYSPFAAYTLLEHKGNFKQAATALAQAFEMQQDAHQRQNGIVTGQAQTSAATAEDLDNLLRIAPWPECPHEAFYGVMGELAQAVKPYTEADPVTLLVQGLLIAGAIIGDRVFYAVGATRHPPREFAVIVGRTGVGRKGTGLDVARWAMTPAPFLDEEGHEQQPTWTFPTIVKGCGSGEGLISAVRDPNYRLEPVRAPAEGGRKGPIVSYERIMVDEGVTDKRVILEETEFASVLHIAQRERNTLSMILRQLWETGDLQNTVKNNPLRATGAHGVVIGHITPEELRAALPTLDITNGFANRFLWICSRKTQDLPDGDELNQVNLHPYRKRLSDAFRQVGEQAKTPTPMRRSPEARAIWHAVYPVLSAGLPGLLGAVLGRAVAHVLRLSCLYALLDGTLAIDAKHLIAALALWRYVEDSAAYLFGEDASGHPDEEKVLHALRRAGDTGLTRTAISVDVFQRHKSKRELTVLLQDLAERGQIQIAEEPRADGRAGRSGQRIRYVHCEPSEPSELRGKRDFITLAQQALVRVRDAGLSSQHPANLVRTNSMMEEDALSADLSSHLSSQLVRREDNADTPVSMPQSAISSLSSPSSHYQAPDTPTDDEEER